ncbi:MAG TPA: chemotaxis protein CheB [Chitinophagales bacterium]|nr:chemotaxis protein CheB [Chitinophagales bacterium]
MSKKRPTTDNLIAASYIIGVGASAGGLEAITSLFENIPDHTGFAYIIVQHLSPDHKSLMAELLSKHTTMKVVEAEDGMQLMTDCVYVLPSKKFMKVDDGRLRLKEKAKTHQPNNAIDVFFESLAVQYKERAIGIVLSGTGTDGTKGLLSIKEHGGIVIVQDPITADFDGMPNSAIAADVADLILPPETMAAELIEYLAEPAANKTFHVKGRRDEVMLRDVLLFIRKATGHDFGYYKRPTLYRRLAKRISELNIHNIRDYLDYLNYHPGEVKILCQEFLINVTAFFRDKDAFDLLRLKVIPSIIGDKNPGDSVKVWSVACSTGEEAYSFAILFSEYMTKHNIDDVNVKIFATDIDKEALEVASKGLYSKSAVQEIAPQRLSQFFTVEGDSYRINPTIRKMVVFSYHDILKDPPFSRMDLITCRNMLIYISAEPQQEILHKLHFALNLDGYLFLGSSEDVGIVRKAMAEVDKKWRIYRCISKTRLNNYESIFSAIDKKNIAFNLPQAKTKNPLQHIAELAKDTLFEQQAFAGIFIDPNMEVKQATGNYKSYITLPESNFNFNLLKLVTPDLAIALSVAIRRATQENESVTMRHVTVHEENKRRNVTITVKPYLQQKDYSQQFLFIVLTEGNFEASPAGVVSSNSSVDNSRLNELERELKETRENLQAVIEEVETANEELQSNNEEMLSTNEELQSTNEELQSLNEELHTVSAEHQLKIKELMELNDDMNNFFRNSDIGQILIDRKLIIRKFSPAITRMVNLIDSDLNRSITDITTRFNDFDFISDIRKVMDESRPVEREISLSDAIYLMRIAPYLKQDNSTDGVVVNFIDVTEIKKLHSILEAILNSAPSTISAMRAIRNTNNEIIDFQYTAANAALEREARIERGQIIHKTFRNLFPEQSKDHFSYYKRVVETGEPVQYEYYYDKTDKWHDIVLVKLQDGLVSISTDITDKKKAADIIAQNYEELKSSSGKLQSMNVELERSNMDLLQFASVASHDLKEPLRKIQTYGNMLFAKTKDRLEDSELSNLKKIITASDRMQRLIEDVLTLSKLSNRDLAMERVDLNEVLSRIVDDLEITVNEKKANIKIGELPVINGITGQMHQLFQNLISNALKFSGAEDASITITAKPISEILAKELDINASDYVCISVKDNGIGFEDIYKEKIFGIFQRLHGNNFEGTGIGLAICKKIVENHKGFLTAQSTLQKGAEFFIVLPV